MLSPIQGLPFSAQAASLGAMVVALLGTLLTFFHVDQVNQQAIITVVQYLVFGVFGVAGIWAHTHLRSKHIEAQTTVQAAANLAAPASPPATPPPSDGV